MNAMQKAISQLQKKCTPIKDENDFEYYLTNNIVFAMEIAIKEAKKEVFDDIEKECPSPIWSMLNKETIIPLKQRHLSTFQKKSNIIADKQNPPEEKRTICHKCNKLIFTAFQSERCYCAD